MDSSVRNPVIRWKISELLCLFLLVLTSCSQGSTTHLPYYKDAELTPYWPESPEQISKVPPVADFSLTNQDGETVTKKDLTGRIVVANFFFASCPSICPLTMENMKRVQEATANIPEILLISHSVDPVNDTANVLKEYAKEKGLSTRAWHLLTGDKKALYRLARGSYFADKDLGQERSDDDFLHTETIYLLDPELRIRGVYNGTIPREINKLLGDLEILRRERPS